MDASHPVSVPIARPAFPCIEWIRVLLLRHEAAAGRHRIRKREEPEFLSGKKNQVFRKSRQVHHRQRGGVKKRRHEVAIARGVETVATTREKPSRAARAFVSIA